MMMKTLTLLACAAAVSAFAGDDAAIHEDEALSISVPSGETWTYSGKILGTSSITKSGLGTLVLSNAENDFTGGLTINEGTVEVAAQGALGAATNPVAVNVSPESLAQLSLKAAVETVSQKIVVTIGGGSKKVAVPSSQVTIKVEGQTTFEEDVHFNRGSNYMTSYGIVAGAGSTSEAVFKKSFGAQTSGSKVSYPGVSDMGAAHFYGKVTCGTKFFVRVPVYLHDDQNALTAVQWAQTQPLYCKTVNALNDCSIMWSDYHGCVEMEGLDQAISSIDWNQTGKNNYSYSDTQRAFHSSTPATLTITKGLSCADGVYAGGDQKHFQQSRLCDEITVVLNTDDADYGQIFTNRENTTTGNIIVSNGLFWVAKHSSFKNVPKIDLEGAGARFLLETDLENSLASVTNLTVNGGATFSIASDAVANPFDAEKANVYLDYGSTLSVPGSVTVRSVHYRTERDGTWTKLPAGTRVCDGTIPQLVGGGSLTVPSSKTNVPATWTAGGADSDVSTAENWSNDGEYAAEGSLAPTFAAAGLEATVSSPLGFYGITFDAPNDFTVRATDESAAIMMSGDSIRSVISEAETERTYSLDVPLNVSEGLSELVVEAASNTVVKLRDIVSFPDVKVVGSKGRVEISGTNVFGGRIEVGCSNAAGGIDGTTANRTTQLRLSGLIGTPNHVDYGEISNSTGPHTLAANVDNVTGTGAEAPLVLAGADVELPVYSNGRASSRATIETAANTANAITGFFLTDSSISQMLRLGDGSVLSFLGGINIKHGLTLYGTGGTVRFGKSLYTRGYFLGCEGTMEFIESEAYSSSYNGKFGGCYVYGANSVVRFTADNAFKNGGVVFRGYGGVLDVGATHQRFNRIHTLWSSSKGSGEITGEAGSVIEITESVPEEIKSTTNICCRVTGGVGFAMTGTGTLLLQKQAFASTGDLAVTNGVLELAADASWLNGTNFMARGVGTLRFNAKGQIDRNVACLHFADEGKVYVPEGIVLKVAAADVAATSGDEPVAVPTGVYDGGTGPLAGRIVGGGSIRVGKQGMLLLVR